MGNTITSSHSSQHFTWLTWVEQHIAEGLGDGGVELRAVEGDVPVRQRHFAGRAVRAIATLYVAKG